MAFVVRRRGGRFEIRESRWTPGGPRATTLATFGTLTPAVLERAEEAAERPFDPSAVMASARRAGASVARPAEEVDARRLVGALAAGASLPPGLRRLLVDRLEGDGPLPELEAGDGVAAWFDAPADHRGEALRDLLDLGDRLPARRRGRLRFPGLRARAGG
jgi:hypothetical protein